MYKGSVKDRFEKAYPGCSSWIVLEDNDWTGFRSKVGIKAKDKAGLKVLRIPKRSPHFNMCDHALWKEVQKRMRAQEKRFPPAFRESRLAFLKRLRRLQRKVDTLRKVVIIACTMNCWKHASPTGVWYRFSR